MNKKLFENIFPSRQEVKPNDYESIKKELTQALESIDHAKLQSVFDERLRSYGVTNKRALLSQDRFDFDLPPDRKSIAQYSQKNKKISISPYWVTERFKGVDTRIAACMIECHEQTHHVSHKECSVISNTEDESTIRTVVGLDEHYLRKSKLGSLNFLPDQSTKLFTFLNEGLTEMFSREILREYLKRDTEFSEKEIIEDFFKKQPKLELVYNSVIPTIEKMIDAVALKVGVSYDTVKESLFAAMFRGEIMSDEDVIDAFDEILGEGFIAKLAYQDVREDQTELTHHLSQQ